MTPMKKLVLPLTLVLLAACTSASSAGGPTGSSLPSIAPSREIPIPTPKKEPNLRPIVDPDNPVTPGFWPLSVAFWDGENGLLAGQLYEFRGRGRHSGAVALTDDGGMTWRPVYEAPVQVDDLRVLADDMAFATLGYRHPKIIVSRDAGETWKVWPESAGLSHASFEAPGVGWALSHYGYGMVRLSNGAWERLKDPCGGEIVDISFPEGGNGRGWVACSLGGGAGSELKAIYETRDGGLSWEAQAVARPDEPERSQGEGLGAFGYLDAISFLPEGSGWLVESRGTFYSTEDGGWTWQQHIGFQQPEIAFGSSVWRVDDATGFALEDRRGMVLHVTHDGGDSWEKVTSFRNLV
jgi:photosystem II stability/assembly factor-like uncharacterized protein